MSKIYIPTDTQAVTVAFLNNLNTVNSWRRDVGALWRMDVVAVDAVTHERCSDDSEHGWATVYGVPGEPGEPGVPGASGGFCKWGAAWHVDQAHRGHNQHWDGGRIELRVLRVPGERAW
jgi:hypothetical protein